MPTAFVPLGQIETEHKLWKNPRSTTGLGDKDIGELAADIKAAATKDSPKGKIIDPPKCVQVKSVNGTTIWLAVDGQRRVIAGGTVLPKSTEIEVVDLYGEPIELTPDKCDELTSMAISMFHREPLSSFELSETAQRMRDEGRELAKIASVIHRSESWVSKMLKARSTASPKLLRSWASGEITDEQFKDLAAQKDAERQAKETEEVVETRKSGDKTEARTKAKEVKESVKAKEADTKKGKPALSEVERQSNKDMAQAFIKAGGQTDPGWTPPADKPKKPPKPSQATIDELLAMADKRPPTHDFVKGVLAGVLYSQGMVELDDLPKPWAAWVSRVGGTVKKKADKPANKVKVAKKASAKPVAAKKAAKASKKARKVTKAKAKKK